MGFEAKLFRKILFFLISDKRFKLIKNIDSKNIPICTILMPIYNQENYVYSHLMAIVNLVQNPVELIIINDASTDRSHEKITNFLKSINLDTIHSFKYFKTRIPVFEARCDDFGIRISNSKYVIEIQSDMLIHEKDFEKKLIDLMEKHEEFAILSCRGVVKLDHLSKKIIVTGKEINDSILLSIYKKLNLKLLRNILMKNLKSLEKSNEIKLTSHLPKKFNLAVDKMGAVFTDVDSGEAGWLGEQINFLPYVFNREFQNKINTYAGVIWKGETVMRGPIIIRKQDYVRLGGFNVLAFYQGMDDHDLSLRARKVNLKVGFTPIYFSSPTNLGSARNNRKIKANLWSKLHRTLRKEHLNLSELYLKYNN